MYKLIAEKEDGTKYSHTSDSAKMALFIFDLNMTSRAGWAIWITNLKTGDVDVVKPHF